MTGAKKRAPLRCPLATYWLAGGSTAGRAFKMRRVYRDMDRFIKIRIRLR